MTAENRDSVDLAAADDEVTFWRDELARYQAEYLDGIEFPEGVRLVLTCPWVPEQYDVFYDDRPLGYIKVRHGRMRADWPDVGGQTVYRAEWPDEPYKSELDEPGEREHHLKTAVMNLIGRDLEAKRVRR